jgi:hypothetical protein
MFAAKKTDQVSAGIQYVGGTSGSFTAATAELSTTISLTSLTGGIASAPSLGDLIVVTAGYASGTSNDLVFSSGKTLGRTYANDGDDTVFAFFVKYALVAEDLTAVRFKTTQAAPSEVITVIVHVYRGATGYFVPSTDVTTIATIDTAIPNPPSITPTVAGSIIHVGAASAHSRGVQTYTASYLSGFITNGGSDLNDDCTAGAGYVTWTSGAYDPAAWTWSGVDSALYSNVSGSLVIAPKVAVTAPTWVGGETATSASGTTLVINKPSGTAENDLLVAICVRANTGGNWTGPSGWTEAADANGISVHYKTAGASEGSSYTFTASGTNVNFGIIMTFRNAAFDLVGSMSNLGNNITIPAITLSSNNSTVIAFARGSSTNNATDYGGEINNDTYTYVYRDVTSKDTWTSITAIKEGVASGSTGTVSAGAFSKDATGFLIGIKPA